MEPNKNIMDLLKEVFSKGKKFTVFYISDSMAICYKQEISVLEIRERDVIFSKKGGRKKYIYPLVKQHYASAPLEYLDHAVFSGHDLPIVADSDFKNPNGTQIYRGNCRYNFVGDPEKIKQYIDQNQLNPFFKKELVEVYQPDCNSDSEPIVLYDKLVS